MRRVVPLLVLAALVAAPPAAVAQSEPFGPLPPPVPEATPVPEPADAPGDDGVSRTTLVLVGLGVLGAFFAIGWAITRDARRSLTQRDRESLDRGPAPETSERSRADRVAAKRRARRRAKAQRAARRRNR